MELSCQRECTFYVNFGTCAYGNRCKFAHPIEYANKLVLNALGLPLRQGQPECAFYLRTGTCCFKHLCKFHHPETAVDYPSNKHSSTVEHNGNQLVQPPPVAAANYEFVQAPKVVFCRPTYLVPGVSFVDS